MTNIAEQFENDERVQTYRAFIQCENLRLEAEANDDFYPGWAAEQQARNRKAMGAFGDCIAKGWPAWKARRYADLVRQGLADAVDLERVLSPDFRDDI